MKGHDSGHPLGRAEYPLNTMGFSHWSAGRRFDCFVAPAITI